MIKLTTICCKTEYQPELEAYLLRLGGGFNKYPGQGAWIDSITKKVLYEDHVRYECVYDRIIGHPEIFRDLFRIMDKEREIYLEIGREIYIWEREDKRNVPLES